MSHSCSQPMLAYSWQRLPATRPRYRNARFSLLGALADHGRCKHASSYVRGLRHARRRNSYVGASVTMEQMSEAR